MKQLIFIFLTNMLICNNLMAQQVKTVKRPATQSTAPTIQKQATGKLLIKCNVKAKIALSGKNIGEVAPDQLTPYVVPAGKSFLTLTATDEKAYLKLDTVIAVTANEQEVLNIKLKENIISASDIIKNMISAIGLNEFGGKINSLSYTISMPKEVTKCT
jgi:S-adenosylmethionine synthetase